MATHLLKRLHFLEDKEGYRYELRYIRDKEGREVDFAVIKDGIIDELIEVKMSDDSLSRSLRYYTAKLNPRKSTQIVGRLRTPYDKDGIQVTDPLSYFGNGLLSTPE